MKRRCLGANRAPRLRDIRDGASNAIMVVEADAEEAVVWTKPDDLPIDPDNPLRWLSGRHEGGFNVVFCDGHVEFMKIKDIDGKKLQAMFTHDGGEPID